MSDFDALADFKALADEAIKYLEIDALPKGYEKRKNGIFYEVEKDDDGVEMALLTHRGAGRDARCG